MALNLFFWTAVVKYAMKQVNTVRNVDENLCQTVMYVIPPNLNIINSVSKR